MGNEPSILYSCSEGRCLFKLIGDIRHTHSSGFNTTIQNLFQGTSTASVVIDLRETQYIDSTNLGLLGIIARNLWKINQTKPTIIIQQNDVYEVLLSMGFDNYFHLVETSEDGNDTLTPILDTANVDAKTILKAHETLIKISDENRSKFHDLVELLKHELHSEDHE